ncbi:hypothetical protein [Brevundimonas sp. R86498]|uniref:hypothetical protein n=1 Tax=Brevundimonas sp. R86498 TaxID=3093845 RepID=UPI0037C542B1
MRILVLVLVASLSAAGCVSEAARQAKEDEALIAASRPAVGARLLDPTSPIFSDVTVRDGQVCGLVRGKNTFGGYVARPKRFTFTERTQATLEPDPGDTSVLRKEAAAGPLCMFDLEYRRCKGEANVPEIGTCLAWMSDNDEHIAGTPVVTQEVAKIKCIEALDADFERKIGKGDFTAGSSQATRRGEGPWQVRVKWTDTGEDPSGMDFTGTCVVNANGLARVTDLFGEE